MSNYILTPEKRLLPSAMSLMEELHRRGFPVEITLKGTEQAWESIRFAESGPPAVECSLSFDNVKGLYTVSISRDAPPQAGELQLYLVDTLLQELGGRADNAGTLERYTPEQFTAKLRNLHSSTGRRWDLFWIGFSWAVVLLAAVVYFVIAPGLRHLVIVILILSLLSAVLQTHSHLKNE